MIVLRAATAVWLGNPDDGPGGAIPAVVCRVPSAAPQPERLPIVTIGRRTQNGIILDDLLASRTKARAILRGEGCRLCRSGCNSSCAADPPRGAPHWHICHGLFPRGGTTRLGVQEPMSSALAPSATSDVLWSHDAAAWILSVLAALAGWLVLGRISISHSHQ